MCYVYILLPKQHNSFLGKKVQNNAFIILLVQFQLHGNHQPKVCIILQIFSMWINVDRSHHWQISTFLQRTGPGLLSVPWPRLTSIQGLHLHQSDTKPHGPLARVSSGETNCDRSCVTFKEMQGLLVKLLAG